MFLGTASHGSTFEKILSMRALEWLIIFVVCKIYGIMEW